MHEANLHNIRRRLNDNSQARAVYYASFAVMLIPTITHRLTHSQSSVAKQSIIGEARSRAETMAAYAMHY